MTDSVLDPRAVVADVLARQHLRPDRPGADVVGTAADLVGLHATGAPNPYLQLLARLPGFSRPDLDRELYERRTLVKLRCMRGTLFVLPAELATVAWAATRERVLAASTAYLRGSGFEPAEYARWADRVEQLLRGRALSAAEVRAELGADRSVQVPIVLNQMCDEGRLLRDRPVAGWRDAHSTYRPLAEAFPRLDLGRYRPDEATTLLARHYVARYGPATLADLGWWTGLGRTRCAQAMLALDDEVHPVRVDGWAGEHLALGTDAARIAAVAGPDGSMAVSVLAGMDPLLMGYRGRSRLVDAAWRGHVYDPSGNATSVVLVDGRVAGVWDLDLAAAEVLCFPFAGWSAAAERRVEDELLRTAAFVTDAPCRLRWVGSMVPLADRRAGGVLRPLRVGADPVSGTAGRRGRSARDRAAPPP